MKHLRPTNDLIVTLGSRFGAGFSGAGIPGPEFSVLLRTDVVLEDQSADRGENERHAGKDQPRQP